MAATCVTTPRRCRATTSWTTVSSTVSWPRKDARSNLTPTERRLGSISGWSCSRYSVSSWRWSGTCGSATATCSTWRQHWLSLGLRPSMCWAWCRCYGPSGSTNILTEMPWLYFLLCAFSKWVCSCVSSHNWHIDNPIVGTPEMTFGVQNCGKLRNVIMHKVISANQKSFLCIVDYSHTCYVERNELSRICRSIRHHFKCSDDTLIEALIFHAGSWKCFYDYTVFFQHGITQGNLFTTFYNWQITIL